MLRLSCWASRWTETVWSTASWVGSMSREVTASSRWRKDVRLSWGRLRSTPGTCRSSMTVRFRWRAQGSSTRETPTSSAGPTASGLLVREIQRQRPHHHIPYFWLLVLFYDMHEEMQMTLQFTKIMNYRSSSFSAVDKTNSLDECSRASGHKENTAFFLWRGRHSTVSGRDTAAFLSIGMNNLEESQVDAGLLKINQQKSFVLFPVLRYISYMV